MESDTMKDINSKGAHVNIAKAVTLAIEVENRGARSSGDSAADRRMVVQQNAADMIRANVACAADIVPAVDRLTAAVVELKATLRSPGVA
jgi:hypothetical protein